MKLIVVSVLVLTMVVSSLGVTRKSMVAEMLHEQKRKLGDDIASNEEDDQNNNVNYEYHQESEGNHHTIPRKEFGKYIGNNSNNENGSG